MRITIDSTEKEILDFCELEKDQAPNYGHEMKLQYGFNLLNLKQEKEILMNQNEYNKAQLNAQNKYNATQLFWSRVTAVATIGLVLVTLLLVKFGSN